MESDALAVWFNEHVVFKKIYFTSLVVFVLVMAVALPLAERVIGKILILLGVSYAVIITLFTMALVIYYIWAN